jgi:hypothetical protein
LQEWRYGVDTDEVILVFNSGEIQLYQWLNSLLTASGGSGGGTGSADILTEILAAGRSLLFSMDGLRIADMFVPDAAGNQLYGLGVCSTHRVENTVQLVDLKEISLHHVLTA